MENVKRAVLLLSGGVESLVVAALFRRDNPTGIGHVFFVRYGQRAQDREQKAVVRIARNYGYNLEIVSAHIPALDNHLLVDKERVILDRTVAKRHNFRDYPKGHIIPWRNVMMLGMASVFAGVTGAAEIWTGFDFTTRPGAAHDKCAQFVGAYQEALDLACDVGRTGIITPVQGAEKVDTIKLGEELGVDWTMSWSCYNDFPKPCGLCGSCRLRIDGMTQAGVDDVEYADESEILGEIGL